MGTPALLRRSRGLKRRSARGSVRACGAVGGLLLLLALGAAPAASAAPPLAGPTIPAARAAAAPKPAGCLIEPDRWADLGSPVVGVVERVGVERGDTVRGGQPLLQLRTVVEQAHHAAAEARSRVDADIRGAEVALALATQKHERALPLQAQQFISPIALEQARGEMQLAVHRLEQARAQQQIWLEESRIARAQLGQRTVRSPFDGVVVERFVNPGERVDERPLLRVAVVDPLRVELMVPVAQWGQLPVGATLTVRPELPGAAPVAATVTRIDPVLDAASNTFRVRLRLPNPGLKLPAGLRCKADLEAAAPASTPAVPAADTATPAPAKRLQAKA